MVYAGLWVEPLREDLEAFINKTQENVTGEVRVRLFKGGLQVVGRSSPMSLYDQNLVNYNIKTGFNQAYSKGFIELWGLQSRMSTILKKKAQNKKQE
jgi:argininosuccinate synthase